MRQRITLLVICFLLPAFKAHAVPVTLIQITCLPDAHTFLLQSYEQGDLCSQIHEPGVNKSCDVVLPELQKQGIYDLSLFLKKDFAIPSCDLGLNQKVGIAVRNFHEPQLTGLSGGEEWGDFDIVLNGQKITDLGIHAGFLTQDILKIFEWSTNRIPHININLCSLKYDGSNTPETVSCSYREISQEESLDANEQREYKTEELK